MIDFYKNRFLLDQNQAIVFEYLSSKAYLKRYFQGSKNEKVEIIAENENPFLQEGEQFDLIHFDEEVIITFKIKVLEIKKNELISMEFYFYEIVDREEGTLDDDLDATNFLKKFFGNKFTYLIELKQKKDKVEVMEYSAVDKDGFFVKILLKSFGFYLNITQRKIYKEIKKEIETIRDDII